MTPENAYAEIIHRSQQAALLNSCAELLGWDEETHMPAGGVEHRGRQLALLAGLHPQRLTEPRLGEVLPAGEDSALGPASLTNCSTSCNRCCKRSWGQNAGRTPRCSRGAIPCNGSGRWRTKWRPRSASTSAAAGSTAPRTRFSPASVPAIAESPRATR